jgi:alkyl sulfatase BDS1-like metallo-beta-lactamase superfamily hydrolase
VLNLENSALTCAPDAQAPNADATLTLTRATLDEISLQKTTFAAALESGKIAAAGSRDKFLELLAMLETFPVRFPIVEPRPPR